MENKSKIKAMDNNDLARAIGQLEGKIDQVLEWIKSKEEKDIKIETRITKIENIIVKATGYVAAVSFVASLIFTLGKDIIVDFIYKGR